MMTDTPTGHGNRSREERGGQRAEGGKEGMNY